MALARRLPSDMTLPFLSRHPYPTSLLRLLPLGALFLLALIPLDRRGSNALETSMAVIAALAGLTTIDLRRWRAILIAAVGVIGGWAVFTIPAYLPQAGEEAARFLLRSRVHLLWMALWWLALPCLVPLWIRLCRISRTGWRPVASRWVDVLVLLVCVHVLWCTLAAAWAVHPRTAYTQLREDLYPFAILFVIIIRSGRLLRVTPVAARPMASILPLLLTAIPLVTVLSMGIVLGLYRGGVITDYARERQWVHVDHLGTDRQLDRIVFPFSHHNRTAYYLLVSGLAAVGAGIWTRRRPMKVLGVVTLLSSALMTWFTLTRGALLAWIMAVLVAGILAVPKRRRQILGGMALMLPVAYLLLPTDARNHIAETARILQVRPGAENTINSRMALWQITVDSIRRRPITGFGYGTGSFEVTMRREFPEVVGNLGGSSHAHNVLLEVAAESGLPAAVTLMAIWLLIAFGCAIIWRQLPPRSTEAQALAIGLVVLTAMFVYGMSNYPLRRGLGVHTVFLVGLVVALADWAQARLRRSGSQPGAPAPGPSSLIQ
jgi:O-antigen ligase